jgi:hypothetical protein
MDSRCSKDSNGILFAIFGCRDQKIWFSEDLDQIWFEIWVWNLFEPEQMRAWHVAYCYSSVPVRMDHQRGALDLKGIGRIWFTRTPLLSESV